MHSKSGLCHTRQIIFPKLEDKVVRYANIANFELFAKKFLLLQFIYFVLVIDITTEHV